MGSLSGKVAIVTGASNGIGRAIAERLGENGAIVVVNYNQSDEKAKHVIKGIQAKGGKAVAVRADMSQVADARRLVIESDHRFKCQGSLLLDAGSGQRAQGRWPHREHFDRWNPFEFSRCDGLSWQQRGAGTVHERIGPGTRSTRRDRQYGLAWFY